LCFESLVFFCGIKEPKDSVMDPIPLFILNCEASPIWFSINFQILGWDLNGTSNVEDKTPPVSPLLVMRRKRS
jgi:hypothetical protein